MTMADERTFNREMITAAETARHNPMRPPDTLPRTGGAALRCFVAHPSPQLIAVALLLLVCLRVWIGAWYWLDALVAFAVLAYFPVNEWLIHVFMLHYRPRKLFRKTVDFALPQSHRRHHADPWNLKWVFIPRHVHLLVFPLIAVLAWVAGPWRGPVLTALGTYLLLGLHYEWVHFLAHIPWCPQSAYYQRRVREHRYHHFRNENYWWGVSMGLGDRLFGTAPDAQAVQPSGSQRTLGLNDSGKTDAEVSRRKL